jgi:hypothetical protein
VDVVMPVNISSETSEQHYSSNSVSSNGDFEVYDSSGVVGINIYSGLLVDGFSLIYSNGEQSDWVGGRGGSYHEASFDTNEILTVEVRTGDNVDGIRFYGKNKYDSGVLGSSGGTSKKHKVPDGDLLVGFIG